MVDDPRKFVLKVEQVKARQGVPAHLASRYAVRMVMPKKGKGSYNRKKNGNEADEG